MAVPFNIRSSKQAKKIEEKDKSTRSTFQRVVPTLERPSQAVSPRNSAKSTEAYEAFSIPDGRIGENGRAR